MSSKLPNLKSDRSIPTVQVTGGNEGQGFSKRTKLVKKDKVLTDYVSKSANSDDQTQGTTAIESSHMSDKDKSPAADFFVVSDSPPKQPTKKMLIEATFKDVDRIMSDIKSKEAAKYDLENSAASIVFK